MIRAQKKFRTSITQVQVNYQTKKLYMVADILKYRSISLIIFYYYAYSGLLATVGVVIQNSMGLMRNAEFGSWMDSVKIADSGLHFYFLFSLYFISLFLFLYFFYF